MYHYFHTKDQKGVYVATYIRKKVRKWQTVTLVHDARDGKDLIVGSEFVPAYPHFEAVFLTNDVCDKNRWLSFVWIYSKSILVASISNIIEEYVGRFYAAR